MPHVDRLFRLAMWLGAGSPRSRGSGPGRPARLRRRAWMAIAASLIVVVASAVGLREWSASTLEAPLHAAVGDHRFCALTFKLAERPIPLAEAAQRFGGVHALLAAVEPATTTLSGGPLRVLKRHSCVFEGRRFVHIVYATRTNRFHCSCRLTGIS